MKKRLLSALLAFVLLLTLTPTAFADGPMTLRQETTGDPNKEFVYYISKDQIVISDPLPSNVQMITTIFKVCPICDKGWPEIDPDFQEKWDEHRLSEDTWWHDNINQTYTVYKITLKNGESVNFQPIGPANKTVYAIREDNYTLSYDVTGAQETVVSDTDSLIFLPLTPLKDGTMTIKRTSVNGSAPVEPETPSVPANVAYPSTQTVDLNGKEVEFQMYALKDENGNDTNYIKIRDLALALSGTGSQFNIGWANGAANIETGKAYVPNGSENYTPFSGERPYTRNTSPTNLNGAGIDLAGIVLTDDSGGGYTYCQVKDLAAKLNFIARWDGARGIICIETNKPYTGEPSPETGACAHNWATRHIDEAGHMEESTGTHTMLVIACSCNLRFRSDDPDFQEKLDEHRNSDDTWWHSYVNQYFEVPDDPKYVVDTPAHDETYCTICGAIQ